MPSRPAGPPAPSLELRLLVHRDLLDACDAAVVEAVTAAVEELLDELGVPGSPTVAVGELGDDTARAQPLLALAVAGRRCPYADSLLPLVRSYLEGAPPEPGQVPSSMLAWLGKLATTPAPEDRPAGLAEFLALTCRAIIQRQPAVLLGREQLEAYRSSLPVPPGAGDGRWPPDPIWLRTVLVTTLGLGISLADVDTVNQVLVDARSRGLAAPDAAERLVARLRPQAVLLCLPREYLRELTTAYGEDRDVFVRYLGELQRDLGMLRPPLRLVADERLRPRSFAVRVNHCQLLPTVGLGADQCLANDSPDRLSSVVGDWPDGRPIPALDPSGGRLPVSVVPASMRPVLEAEHFAVWNPMEVLAMSLLRVLREQAPRLVDVDDLELRLTLAQLPSLTTAVTSRFSTFTLTRLVRALAGQQLAIDLRRILERLLDYQYRGLLSAGALGLEDTSLVGSPGLVAQGDDFGAQLAFVRSGLRRQISARYAYGTATMVVYLLGKEIEERLAAWLAARAEDPEASLPDDQYEELVAAISDELGYLPPTARRPALLTTAPVRGALAEILAARFPELAAVAYQELVPEVNLQPVARISLGG